MSDAKLYPRERVIREENRYSAVELTVVYLGRHGGGGYGIRHSGGNIAGAVGRRHVVVLRRRIDAEGRHEFRSVNVEGREFALDGGGLAVLRRRRARDDVAVVVCLLLPRVAVRHVNRVCVSARTTAGRSWINISLIEHTHTPEHVHNARHALIRTPGETGLGTGLKK